MQASRWQSEAAATVSTYLTAFSCWMCTRSHMLSCLGLERGPDLSIRWPGAFSKGRQQCQNNRLAVSREVCSPVAPFQEMWLTRRADLRLGECAGRWGPVCRNLQFSVSLHRQACPHPNGVDWRRRWSFFVWGSLVPVDIWHWTSAATRAGRVSIADAPRITQLFFDRLSHYFKLLVILYILI